MAPAVIFGIGIVIYSIIERRDLKFVLLNAAFGGALVAAYFLTGLFADGVLQAVSVGVLLIAAGFLPRLIAPMHPIEAGGDSVKDPKEIVSIGIVDCCWISIMGVALMGVIYIGEDLLPLLALDKIQPDAGIRSRLLDVTMFFLGKLIDAVFFFAGGLAACMTILWAGTIWRKTGEIDRKQYKASTFTAMKMVFAFFLVVLVVAIYVALPLISFCLEVLGINKK